MFRRTVFILIAGFLLFVQAAGVGAAGNPDNGPGCGLGKLAWMDYGGQKQIAEQRGLRRSLAVAGQAVAR